MSQEQELYRNGRILFGYDVSNQFLSTLEEPALKHAYRQAALRTHPDSFANTDNHSQTLFVAVNQAYQALSSYIAGRANGPGTAVPTPGTATRSKSFAPIFYNGEVPETSLRLVEFLYYTRVISWNVMIDAIIWQRQQRPRFGDMAKQRRLLGEDDIRTIFTKRKIGKKIGSVAVRLGLMSAEEVNAILDEQKNLQPPIGLYFTAQGYLEADELDLILSDLQLHNVRSQGKNTDQPE